MRKSFVTMGLVVALSMATSMTALAGWEQTGTTWKYQNADKTYMTNTWNWIDGNGDGIAECYNFDSTSFMRADTVTPDGYTVNADGAWTVNGIVQTKVVGEDTSTSHDNKTSTPTPESQAKVPETTNSNPQVETPTTGGGQSMADVFPGWEGGEPTPDDVSSYPIGAGEAGNWY